MDKGTEARKGVAGLGTSTLISTTTPTEKSELRPILRHPFN